MPGGDRTGPAGMGPATGRGAGYCASSGMPGFANQLSAGHVGRGRRGGRGWRNMFRASGLPGWVRLGVGAAGAALAAGAVRGTTREQELEALKQQADQATRVLEGIRQRISQLEGGTQQ